MADVRSDIEETFAFGKMRAEKGGARFKTGKAMWKYMKANAGNHKHSFNEKSIYANVDINLKETSADETKVKGHAESRKNCHREERWRRKRG